MAFATALGVLQLTDQMTVPLLLAGVSPKERVERTLRALARQPLDRGDRAPVRLDGQDGARLHRLAIDDHGAGAAMRRVAPDVRARQPQFAHEAQNNR